MDEVLLEQLGSLFLPAVQLADVEGEPFELLLGWRLGEFQNHLHKFRVPPRELLAAAEAGYVDLTQFYLYLKALDAMINLRYPSAGESSGTFARALAEGRAVIVNNYGSFAEVPGDVALKVEMHRTMS